MRGNGYAMNKKELYKKYELYDQALTPEERIKADGYRKYAHVFLAATWISAIVFVGLVPDYEFSVLAADFHDVMIPLGALTSLISLGLFLVFSGKDTILRKYSVGTEKATFHEPLFDTAAVNWGKTKIKAGYVILGLLACVFLIVAFHFFFPDFFV